MATFREVLIAEREAHHRARVKAGKAYDNPLNGHNVMLSRRVARDTEPLRDALLNVERSIVKLERELKGEKGSPLEFKSRYGEPGKFVRAAYEQLRDVRANLKTFADALVDATKD